ncbi:Pre-mRNA branch site protein p14, partial [Fukomys damarensis]
VAGDVQAVEAVLIHAGSSGVGTAAIQLAQRAGTIPLVTAGSQHKLQMAEDFGAAAGFNYKEGDFSEATLKFTKGASGTVLIWGYKQTLVKAFTEQILPHFSEEGPQRLLPVLDSVYPWTEVRAAHQYMEANRNVGKVALELPPPKEEALEPPPATQAFPELRNRTPLPFWPGETLRSRISVSTSRRETADFRRCFGSFRQSPGPPLKQLCSRRRPSSGGVRGSSSVCCGNLISPPRWRCKQPRGRTGASVLFILKGAPFRILVSVTALAQRVGFDLRLRPSWGNTPETRGTAYVVYEDIFDAKNACDHLSGFNVCNRYLVVLYYNANRAFQKMDTKKKEEQLKLLKEKYGINTDPPK